jgi:hypothetical protein
MFLLEHLNKNGLDPEAMMENFGVRVTTEGDLALLKYADSGAKWTEALTHECRGVIVRQVGDQWHVVSRPWNKFWNLHEGYCPIRGKVHEHTDALVLHEKADGTCIHVWWDDVREVWRASTLGTITPMALHGKGQTFDALFWETSGIRPFLDYLHRGSTYLFELCTPHNRIVTKYERPHVVFLGARRNADGAYYDTHYHVLGSQMEAATMGSIRRPHGHVVSTLGLRTDEDLVAWVEAQSNDPRYGQWPEGFVAYLGNAPVAKIKNQRYLQLHAVGGGDVATARKRVQQALFGGTIDDVEQALVDDLVVHLEALRASVRHMSAEAIHTMNAALADGPFTDRKAFALAVQRHVPARYQAWAYLRGPVGALAFDEWLAQHYTKLQTEWDSLP